MGDELQPIRVETALSRYPIHRLSKTGEVDISIGDPGEGDFWQVSPSARHGHPGPLAYKLDTVVINRRLEEAGTPTPRVLRLGSLNDIARQLGLSGGSNIAQIKKALQQNALTGINARVTYRTVEGGEKTIEITTYRYSVIMTGQKFADGRRADAVYLILSDFFKEVMDSAVRRPLDYDYLRDLTPASQRLYELLSYQVYAALKNGHEFARLLYSDFCTFAPQARYDDYDHAKKQMWRVNEPHRKSGYIESVAMAKQPGPDGRPDWVMTYRPGPKAFAEFEAFTRRLARPRAARPAPTAPCPLPAIEAARREQTDQRAVNEYIAGLTPEQLAEIDAEVMALPEYRDSSPVIKRLRLAAGREEFARRMLSEGGREDT